MSEIVEVAGSRLACLVFQFFIADVRRIHGIGLPNTRRKQHSSNAYSTCQPHDEGPINQLTDPMTARYTIQAFAGRTISILPRMSSSLLTYLNRNHVVDNVYAQRPRKRSKLPVNPQNFIHTRHPV